MVKKALCLFILFNFIFFPKYIHADSADNYSNLNKYGPYKIVGDFEISKNFYGFSYKNQDGFYININGEELGPYYHGSDQTQTDIVKGDLESAGVSVSENNWGYYYAENTVKENMEYNSTYYIVTKDKTFGPYEKINWIEHFDVSDEAWGFSYEKNHKFYVIINGKEYGPYDHINKFILSGSNWGFSYASDSKDYVIVNDVTYGPYSYQSVYSKTIIKKNNWIFKRGFSGNYYLMVKGFEHGPYYYVNDFTVSDNKWSFTGSKKINEEIFDVVSLNGEEYLTYNSPHNLKTTNNIEAFTFLKENNRYVRINNQEFGPFDSSLIPVISLFNDKWGFIYKDNEKYYANINNNIYGPYDKIFSERFIVLDKNFIFRYQNNDSKYININGEVHGPYEQAYFSDDSISDNNSIFVNRENGAWYFNLFNTGGNNDVYNPQNDLNIQNTQITNITPTSAIITWDSTSGEGEYRYSKDITDLENLSWISNNVVNTIVSIKSVVSEVSLTNLEKNSKYYIEARKYTTYGASGGYLYGNSNITNFTTMQEEEQTMNIININNNEMYSRLNGKIMLKVEDAGKAYYIHPQKKTMHYLGRPADAFQVMREQGVGITNSNLEKIPIGLGNLTGLDSDGDGLPDLFEDAIGTDKNNKDTDGDGYNDKDELNNGYSPNSSGKLNIDSSFSSNQKGKIFLQVERNGEAWYINPDERKRYFLGRPADAFQVMRNLGLGISNNDFDSL